MLAQYKQHCFVSLRRQTCMENLRPILFITKTNKWINIETIVPEVSLSLHSFCLFYNDFTPTSIQPNREGKGERQGKSAAHLTGSTTSDIYIFHSLNEYHIRQHKSSFRTHKAYFLFGSFHILWKLARQWIFIFVCGRHFGIWLVSIFN